MEQGDVENPARPPFAAIRRFGPNLSGADYVVGDIHGEFSLVEEALAAAGFDPAIDRLFCVGDLVDRGSESPLAASFLKKPGVFSIKGNHDDDLVQLARALDGKDGPFLEFAGRQGAQAWWFALDRERREEIVAAFEELPLAFEIQTGQGMVCLVHAEPAAETLWRDFAALLEEGDPVAVSTALWDREIAEGRAQGGCSDVWRVFAGHTPAPDGPMKKGNIFFVDSGAVFGRLGIDSRAHLTLARIEASEEALMSPRVLSGLFEIKADLAPAFASSPKM